MDGQWQQHNSDVHAELDLAIASPGDFNLILQDLGDDFDGLLGPEPNTIMGNTGDATAAATADQDNNGRETHGDERTPERATVNRGRRRINRKRHHKDQIQELEAAFRVNQHPDDQERRNLGVRIGMAAPQVKFWFQNRRSALRTQDHRQELTKLKEENQALQAESRDLRLATENRTCLTCQGARERQHLLSENEMLKERLRRANAFLQRVSGGSAEAMPVAMPCGSHGPVTNHNVVDAGKGKAVATDHALPHRPLAGPMVSANEGLARSQRDTNNMLIDIASRALSEFRVLLYSGSPVWMPAPDGEVELINLQNYVDTMFPSIFGPYRTGSVVDGTRKSGDVMCTADYLVGVLMDAASWSEMFPGIVVSASASHIVTPNTASPHEMIIVMDAGLRVLSPRLPVRKIKFLRQCRQVKPGTWAVVDVSVVDGILGEDGGGAPLAHKARFLPSGCLIEERNNRYCKVTWIVNMEYENVTVSEKYPPLLRSGQALGAGRWIASLQRRCEYHAIVLSYINNGGMTPNGRMNIFEVAQRMTRSFYEAVCGPWTEPWRSLGEWQGGCGIGTERFKVVTRVVTYTVSSGAPMEQAGAVVLNVIAPVKLPGIPPQQVYDYLCDFNRRGEWDSLANGAPVLQEGYYATGQLPGNAVSVLRTIASDKTNSNLILQEACADTSCMVLAYATMDEQYMQHAMNNGGAASLPLLPSGVVILPDGESPVSAACSSSTAVSHGSGSLIAVMYQKLLNGNPPEVLSLEAIDNADNLLCRVIRKIKDAVHANSVEAA